MLPLTSFSASSSTTFLIPFLVISILTFLSSPVLAIAKISRTGKYLYDETGSRFYIKGVAYQPQGQVAANTAANAANGGFPDYSSFYDPLSSGTNCTRDLPYLQQLGVNAIRVYSVNAAANHDSCMATFSAAGIYLILDVSLPLNGSIDRASPSWSTNLLDAYITTIDAFAKYDNVLAYNVGNEVINLPSNTDAAPYVKAAARDIKAYLTSQGSSALIGYASVDGDEDFRVPLANYLTCGNDTISIDLYGLNNYEWCGSSTYATSGWETITNDFSGIQVATYMSEYGCITNPPRLWQEVPVLYSQPVTNVFSGGVAFSYFPTADGYGMVTFGGSNGQTVQTSSDFNLLAAQLKNVTSTPNTPAQSTLTVTDGTCPTAENATFQASTTLPPTPDESVCNCIYKNALSCVVNAATANQPIIVGALLDYACSLLGSNGGAASCTAIGGNGTAGQYGPLEFCSPSVKLSYVFSAYYEEQQRVATACDFGGNATIVAQPPNTAQDASTAASSCLAQEPAGGVFTPSASASSSATSSTASTATSSKASSASSSKVTSGSALTISRSTTFALAATCGSGLIALVVGGAQIFGLT